jgi:hypothetical protein
VILDLTAEQEAQRQQFGACVVHGEPNEWKFEDTIYTPHQQFRDADGPCPTCGGSGKERLESGAVYTCQECRGSGKPVVELRVPYDHQDYGTGTVVVARATVTLLPVKSSDAIDDFTVPVVELNPYGELWQHPMIDPLIAYGLIFDPLPTPGRDWVAVVTVLDAQE